MTPEELARDYFNNGYNCAESTLLALSRLPAFQGRRLEGLIPRAATGFGGGLARNGLVCGALAGAAIAIGVLYGRDDSQQSRDPCYAAVDRLVSEFREAFGSLLCRDLTRLDLKSEFGMRFYRQKVHFEVCNPIVVWTVRRAEEIIAETASGSSGLA